MPPQLNAVTSPGPGRGPGYVWVAGVSGTLQSHSAAASQTPQKMGLQACLGMCVNAILLLTENSDREERHHFTSVKTMWPSVFVVAFMCGTDRSWHML